jgi:hypothetical protein
MKSAGLSKDSPSQGHTPTHTDTEGIDLSKLSRSQMVNASLVSNISWSAEEKARFVQEARKAYPGKKVFEQDGDIEVMFFAPHWLEDQQAYLTVMRVYKSGYLSIMYGAFYTSNWEKIEEPRPFGALTLPAVVPIPIYWGEESHAGPEDPRIFVSPDGRLTHVLFNMLNASTQRSIYMYTNYFISQ